MRSHIHRAILTVAVLAAAGAVCAPAYAERTPPGSFLKWRVNSGETIASQVLSEKSVGNLYATFYGASADKVAEAFRSMKLISLSSDLKVRVYFIGRGGKVINEVRILKKGRLVFVDSAGKPVLDARCGNPLTKELPKVPVAPVPKPASSLQPIDSAESVGYQMATYSPQPEFGFGLAEPPNVVMVESIPPAIIETVAKRRFPFWLPLVFFQPPDEPNPPVPEPASMVLTGAGLALAGAFRKRYAKKQG